MPKDLKYLENADTDDALYELLIARPVDLVSFFETAADDETWSENHEMLITKAFRWLSEQAYNDKLPQEFVERLAKAVQKHYSVFKTYLSKDILIKLKDKEIPFNEIMLYAASDYFKQLVLKEGRDKDSHSLSFPKISFREISPIETFINTGAAPEILTMGQEELIELISRTISWEILTLSELAQKALVKYLTDENVVNLLIKAKQERWLHFAQSCAEYISKREWGFQLGVPQLERLSFEFMNFETEALQYFALFRSLITDLICRGNLIEHQQFGIVLKQCPGLISVDISKTFAFSLQLVEIPVDIQEINISECPWISKDSLKRFLAICPDLKQINLTADTHLNFAAWGELAKFKKLKKLSLAHCHQIQNPDIGIIVKGCGALKELSLKNCSKIDQTAFLEIAKGLPDLVALDLSRCALSDHALVEIGSHCRSLTVLDVSGCDQLTEKGLLALIKNGTALQELNITRCHISLPAIEEIRKIAPSLRLLSDL